MKSLENCFSGGLRPLLSLNQLHSFCFSEPHERAKVPDKGDHCVTDLNRNENSCHDDIQRSAQQLIDDINAKRKRDTDLLNGNFCHNLVCCNMLMHCDGVLMQ